ncbi:MAG: response regulator [Elusimicrobia bacterium]|nr:response regulator [Elusimicrobiota bacterium]
MTDNYVRISDLAKKASVLSSTIRHYTDIGLLQVAMETDGGHRLYDVESSMRRLGFIHSLSKRGRSLDEIKAEMGRRQNHLVVLLVDDEPEVVDFVRSAFELYSNKPSGNGKKMPAVDLSVVSDGFTAGKKTSEILPDLVILDLMLPGINGFKICRAIREDAELAGVKILAITGYDTEENRRAIMAAGANGYLAKPFGVQELIKKLEEMGIW